MVLDRNLISTSPHLRWWVDFSLRVCAVEDDVWTVGDLSPDGSAYAISLVPFVTFRTSGSLRDFPSKSNGSAWRHRLWRSSSSWRSWRD